MQENNYPNEKRDTEYLKLKVSLNEIEREDFQYSPDEILQNIGKIMYVYEITSGFLAQYSSLYEQAAAKVRVLILANRFDLLKNKNLAEHLAKINEVKSYKHTKDDIESLVFIELLPFSAQIQEAGQLCKKCEKKYDMWQKILSYHQTLLRKQIQEIDFEKGVGRNGI